MGLNEWDDASGSTEISMQEMDRNLELLRELKEDHAQVDKLKKEAYAKYKAQEEKVIAMLEQSGKRKYVSDFGNVTITHELSVKTPKTPEQKRAFFNWIYENLGEEARDVYMTVNSRSLNSLYKEQAEIAASRGNVLSIDGLEEPTSVTKLSFRKA